MKRVVTSFVSNCYQLLMPAVALHCSSVTFKNEGMLFLIESTDNGKYRLLHSQTPHFKDTWLCENSRNGINLAIPGSDGQTKNFFGASFFYYKLHITLLFCSLNWYREAFMASETFCLFASCPGFHAHRGCLPSCQTKQSRQKRVELSWENGQKDHHKTCIYIRRS